MYRGVSVIENKPSRGIVLWRGAIRANFETGGMGESKCLLSVNGGQEQGPGGNGAESEVPQPPANT